MAAGLPKPIWNEPGACQTKLGTDEGLGMYDWLCGLNEPAWKSRHSPGVAHHHGVTMIFDDEDTHSYHRTRPTYPVAAFERLVGAATIDTVLRIALLHEPQATAIACGLSAQQADLIADIQAADLHHFAAALQQRLYPQATAATADTSTRSQPHMQPAADSVTEAETYRPAMTGEQLAMWEEQSNHGGW